jgi:hypothetical protein
MIDSRPIILVAGAPLSGVTSVAGALADRLKRHRVLERLGPGERPAAVVFVVSAAAPLTESDAAVLDVAAASTDAVVAAVSKIDVHRAWPQVLDTNRALLARHAARYAGLAWVPVAADPQIGPVRVDQLVEQLRAVLSRPARSPRKPLRTIPLRPQIPVRPQMQQIRVQISAQVRTVCLALRTDLRDEAAEVNRREVDEFCSGVRRRVMDVAAELEARLTGRLTHLTGGLELSVPPCPPLDSYLPQRCRPRPENRLTVSLSAGFGLGISLTVSRVLADIAPDWTPAVTGGALVAGVVLTVWVIRTRGVMAQRAALDRWVIEVTAGLRAAMEDELATRLSAAEFALAAAAAAGETAALRRFPNPAWSDRT